MAVLGESTILSMSLYFCHLTGSRAGLGSSRGCQRSAGSDEGATRRQRAREGAGWEVELTRLECHESDDEDDETDGSSDNFRIHDCSGTDTRRDEAGERKEGELSRCRLGAPKDSGEMRS